jgi:hypothetical protein
MWIELEEKISEREAQLKNNPKAFRAAGGGQDQSRGLVSKLEALLLRLKTIA